MLFAKLFQNLGARCRLVAENAGDACLFDEFVDHFIRKAIGIHRKRLVVDHSHHLPVACLGVFATGSFFELAVEPARSEL